MRNHFLPLLKGEVEEGEKDREGEGEGRRKGDICGLHFFKGTAVQDFLSKFFAPYSFFESHWAQGKTALNKFEFKKISASALILKI
jgi:hypothetical protein